jgi:hypothetical protein
MKIFVISIQSDSFNLNSNVYISKITISFSISFTIFFIPKSNISYLDKLPDYCISYFNNIEESKYKSF